MFSLTSVFNFQAYKLTGFTVTFFSLDRVSLCSPGYPGKTGLELRDPTDSTSQGLALKVWATNAQLIVTFFSHMHHCPLLCSLTSSSVCLIPSFP